MQAIVVERTGGPDVLEHNCGPGSCTARLAHATASATDSPVQTRGPHRLHQRDPAGLGHYPRPGCVNPNLSRGSQASAETGHMTGPCPGHGSVRTSCTPSRRLAALVASPTCGRRWAPSSAGQQDESERADVRRKSPTAVVLFAVSLRPAHPASRAPDGVASRSSTLDPVPARLRSGSYEVDGSDQAEAVAKHVAKHGIDHERLEFVRRERGVFDSTNLS